MEFFIVAILGLMFGSFVNALVGRLKAKRDWVKERSACDSCGQQLAPADLVPVISWLLLKGRCRYCHKKISAENPLVELLMALLFVASYVYWPHGLSSALELASFGLWLGLVVVGVALAIYDIKWMILPDNLVRAAVRLAGASWLIAFYNSDYNIRFVLATVVSLAVSSGLFYLIFQFSKGEWIGGGDVKFGVVYGLLLADPLKSLLVIFLASFLGSIVSIPILLSPKRKTHPRIPFGPFLILAMFIVYIWGSIIINWYQHLLAY